MQSPQHLFAMKKSTLTWQLNNMHINIPMKKQKEKITLNMKNNIIPIIFKTLQQLLLHFLLSLLLEKVSFSLLLLILIFPVWIIFTGNLFVLIIDETLLLIFGLLLFIFFAFANIGFFFDQLVLFLKNIYTFKILDIYCF